jgi:tetratricopeptide (TPR) repeat protein
LLALLCLLADPTLTRADSPPAESIEPALDAAIETLDKEWSEIFYRPPTDRQAEQYQDLLARIRELKARHPKRAELLILEAITLCTLAAADWGFDSLSRIGEAKELLEESIGLNPKAMEGTAFITLGNLYYRLPGWPIAFGDDGQALQYLEMAVKLYPNSLDANYFLGDYWLGEEEYEKAIPYLEKAEKAPIRPYHQLSDRHVKGEVEKALKAARNHDSRKDFFAQFLPNFGE